MTQTVPDISPLMPMHQDPLLVSSLVATATKVLAYLGHLEWIVGVSIPKSCLAIKPRWNQSWDGIMPPVSFIRLWRDCHKPEICISVHHSICVFKKIGLYRKYHKTLLHMHWSRFGLLFIPFYSIWKYRSIWTVNNFILFIILCLTYLNSDRIR